MQLRISMLFPIHFGDGESLLDTRQGTPSRSRHKEGENITSYTNLRHHPRIHTSLYQWRQFTEIPSDEQGLGQELQ